MFQIACKLGFFLKVIFSYCSTTLFYFCLLGWTSWSECIFWADQYSLTPYRGYNQITSTVLLCLLWCHAGVCMRKPVLHLHYMMNRSSCRGLMDLLNCNDLETVKIYTSAFLKYRFLKKIIKKHTIIQCILAWAQFCNETSNLQTFQLMKNIPTYSLDSHEGRASDLLCFI